MSWLGSLKCNVHCLIKAGAGLSQPGLSQQLYSLAIEPVLYRLNDWLSGFFSTQFWAFPYTFILHRWNIFESNHKGVLCIEDTLSLYEKAIFVQKLKYSCWVNGRIVQYSGFVYDRHSVQNDLIQTVDRKKNSLQQWSKLAGRCSTGLGVWTMTNNFSWCKVLILTSLDLHPFIALYCWPGRFWSLNK